MDDDERDNFTAILIGCGILVVVCIAMIIGLIIILAKSVPN